MEILRPLEQTLDKLLIPSQLSEALTDIGIIPICMSQRLLQQGFGNERTYVSRKRGRADIRLQIDYAAFAAATQAERRELCRQNIIRAAQILQKRDPTFQKDLLLSAARKVFTGTAP